MKKTIVLLSAIAFLFTITSCGVNAEKDAEKAGKLSCKIKELNKEQEAIREKIDKVMETDKWEDNEEKRAEIADYQMELDKLQAKEQDLYNKVTKIANKRWKIYENKSEYDAYEVDFEKAYEEYIKANCKD
jgi:outer membrane murein-binding lipoprotein Lpp